MMLWAGIELCRATKALKSSNLAASQLQMHPKRMITRHERKRRTMQAGRCLFAGAAPCGRSTPASPFPCISRAVDGGRRGAGRGVEWTNGRVEMARGSRRVAVSIEKSGDYFGDERKKSSSPALIPRELESLVVRLPRQPARKAALSMT